MGSGGVVGRGDRRRRGGIGAAVGWRRGVVTVVGLVFDDVSCGGCGGRVGGGGGERIVGVTAVEVAVAATGCAFEGGGVGGGGGWGGHELAAAVEGVAAEAGRMVLQTFSVRHHDGVVVVVVVIVVMVVVAFQYSVAERQGLGGLDPGRSLALGFWGFCGACSCDVGGGGGDCWGGYFHGSNI